MIYLDPLHSLTTLTAEMKRLGLRTTNGKPLSRSAIAKLLANPLYIGKIRWQGQVYQGIHEALWSVATFNAVQRKLAGGRPIKFQRRDPLFRGQVHCDRCGSTVSWSLQKGRFYGRCESRRPCPRSSYVREDRLEAQLQRRFDELRTADTELLEWAISEVIRDQQGELERREAHVKLLRSRHNELARRKAVAYEDRLDSRITAEQYDAIVAKYRAEQDEIAEQLRTPKGDWLEVVRHNAKIIIMAQHVGRIYRAGDKATRRALLSELVSNLRLDGTKVLYDWQEVPAVLYETLHQIRLRSQRLELDENGSAKGKEALVGASRSIWCALTSKVGTLKQNYHAASAARLQELLKSLADCKCSLCRLLPQLTTESEDAV
jgi:hypothetical protein